jgi:hypothetical protein
MNTAIESYQFIYTEQMQVNKEIENEITQKDKYLTAITNQDFQNKQQLENEALGKEISEMETALYDHKEDLQSKLVESKKAYEDQTAQIQYLEEKIDFFEENYPNLMTNLKAAHEKRNLLANLYESMPKDLKREHLADMVKHITMKSKAHRKLTTNTLTMITNLKKTLAEDERQLKMMYTSINVTLKNEKKKDAQNLAIMDLMEKARQVFDATGKVLIEIIDIKTENKVFEDKIKELDAMNYGEAIAGLNQELGEGGEGEGEWEWEA